MQGCSAVTRPWSARRRFALLAVLDCAPPAAGPASEHGAPPVAVSRAAGWLALRAQVFFITGRRMVRPRVVCVRRVEGTTDKLGADVDVKA